MAEPTSWTVQALLGGRSVCRALQGHLAAFVGLRRYENMTLQQLMHGVSIQDIAVLSGAVMVQAETGMHCARHSNCSGAMLGSAPGVPLTCRAAWVCVLSEAEP